VAACSVGMQDVATALDMAEAYQGRKHFVGPRDVRLIQAAENALGVQFPPTYRTFLERLGAGSIRGREVYGVIDADFQESTIPDGIWLTLSERQDSELPKSLVIVHSTGDGDYVAIDTSKRTAESENPMVLWHPGVSTTDDELEEVSDDFGQFFLELVREATD
jgi:cell wall assembly regulator SMI1